MKKLIGLMLLASFCTVFSLAHAQTPALPPMDGGGQEVGGGDEAQDRYMRIWRRAIEYFELYAAEFPTVSAVALRRHIDDGFRPFPVDTLSPCDGLRRPVACYYPGTPPRVDFSLARYNALTAEERIRNPIHELLRSEGLDDDYDLTDALMRIVPYGEFMDPVADSCPTMRARCTFHRNLTRGGSLDLNIYVRQGQSVTVEVQGEFRFRGETETHGFGWEVLDSSSGLEGYSISVSGLGRDGPLGFDVYHGMVEVLSWIFSTAPGYLTLNLDPGFRSRRWHYDYVRGEVTVRIMNPDVEPASSASR